MNDVSVIKNCSLSIAPGSVHVLMGPNGSGKSTLACALIGDPCCSVTSGDILFNGKNIKMLRPDERARLGLFCAFQHPCAIPGLTVFSFLKAAYNSRFATTVEVDQFRQILYEKMDVLGIDYLFAFRGVNEGFSGGEKKRLEILQLLVLNPRLAILDEIDSGLDIDALSVVANSLVKAQKENSDLSFLIITHRQNILQHLQPDHVHVFCNGSIVCSGGKEVVAAVERDGYEIFVS